MRQHGIQITRGGVGAEGTSVADTSFLAPLFPLTAMLFSFYHIAEFEAYKEVSCESTSLLFQRSCFICQSPVLYLFAFGFAGAKLCNKLIVAHMAKVLRCSIADMAND